MTRYPTIKGTNLSLLSGYRMSDELSHVLFIYLQKHSLCGLQDRSDWSFSVARLLCGPKIAWPVSRVYFLLKICAGQKAGVGSSLSLDLLRLLRISSREHKPLYRVEVRSKRWRNTQETRLRCRVYARGWSNNCPCTSHKT